MSYYSTVTTAMTHNNVQKPRERRATTTTGRETGKEEMQCGAAHDAVAQRSNSISGTFSLAKQINKNPHQRTHGGV